MFSTLYCWIGVGFFDELHTGWFAKAIITTILLFVLVVMHVNSRRKLSIEILKNIDTIKNKLTPKENIKTINDYFKNNPTN